MIKLGSRVRDTITKFEGVVIARTDWLNGCRRFGVQSEKLDKEGIPTDAQWFDEPQLVEFSRPLEDSNPPLTEGKTKLPPGGPPVGGVEAG